MKLTGKELRRARRYGGGGDTPTKQDKGYEGMVTDELIQTFIDMELNVPYELAEDLYSILQLLLCVLHPLFPFALDLGQIL